MCISCIKWLPLLDWERQRVSVCLKEEKYKIKHWRGNCLLETTASRKSLGPSKGQREPATASGTARDLEKGWPEMERLQEAKASLNLLKTSMRPFDYFPGKGQSPEKLKKINKQNQYFLISESQQYQHWIHLGKIIVDDLIKILLMFFKMLLCMPIL